METDFLTIATICYLAPRMCQVLVAGPKYIDPSTASPMEGINLCLNTLIHGEYTTSLKVFHPSIGQLLLQESSSVC